MEHLYSLKIYEIPAATVLFLVVLSVCVVSCYMIYQVKENPARSRDKTDFSLYLGLVAVRQFSAELATDYCEQPTCTALRGNNTGKASVITFGHVLVSNVISTCLRDKRGKPKLLIMQTFYWKCHRHT